MFVFIDDDSVSSQDDGGKKRIKTREKKGVSYVSWYNFIEIIYIYNCMITWINVACRQLRFRCVLWCLLMFMFCKRVMLASVVFCQMSDVLQYTRCLVDVNPWMFWWFSERIFLPISVSSILSFNVTLLPSQFKFLPDRYGRVSVNLEIALSLTSCAGWGKFYFAFSTTDLRCAMWGLIRAAVRSSNNLSIECSMIAELKPFI